MVPKISVIVPVYNGENWIERCIEGVLSQSFVDWELIIIDDGSKDRTFQILENHLYLIPDNYLIKIIKKENGGVSSARNAGIEKAIGEYITFIDVDDIIEPTYLENLAKGFGYDYVVTGFCYDASPQKAPVNNGQKYCSKNEIALSLDVFLNTDHFCFPWARLFRTSILKDYNIRFDTNMRFAEDHVFNWKYLCHINTLYLDESTLYNKIADKKEYNLNYDELDYIDGKLYNLKRCLETYYGVELHPSQKTFCHVLFLKDYLILYPCSFYAKYYKKYHPQACEREVYDYIANNIFHPGLQAVKNGKYTYSQMRKFIDEPWKLFNNTKIHSRLFIPLIKMGIKL